MGCISTGRELLSNTWHSHIQIIISLDWSNECPPFKRLDCYHKITKVMYNPHMEISFNLKQVHLKLLQVWLWVSVCNVLHGNRWSKIVKTKYEALCNSACAIYSFLKCPLCMQSCPSFKVNHYVLIEVWVFGSVKWTETQPSSYRKPTFQWGRCLLGKWTYSVHFQVNMMELHASI